MEIYTYQVGQWPKVQQHGIPLLDTTVKSGDPRLAPTWEMVLGVKRGTWSEAAYTQAYYEMLDYTFFADPAFWDNLLSRPQLALGCYCPAHAFCHRYLLVSFLQRVGHVTYHGELTPRGLDPVQTKELTCYHP